MVGVDPEIGSAALRFWLAAGSAALLVVAGLLVLAQWRANALRSLARSGIIVVLGAAIATSMAWAFLDYSRGRDREADRQALEMRAEQLTGLALAPGSALSCLDAMSDASVEAACEKALFATPATVAAAGAYVAAELGLLSDMVAFVENGGRDIDNVLLPLRRSLEADRFGFLAHVLAVRDGCTTQDCKALELLHDSSRVRTNLSKAALDHYLEQYQAAWTQPPPSPVAEAPRPEPTETALVVPPSQRKVLVNIDFPTAASIPPISIMNPEPTGRVPSGVTAAAATNPDSASTAETSPRRLRKQAANPPSQAVPPSAPASADPTQTQEDPVWLPAAAAPIPRTVSPMPPAAAPTLQTTAPTPQAAAPAAGPTANFAAGPAVPVQLNPFAAQR